MKQFRVTNEGDIQTTLRGLEVLSVPFLNKGVAFTEEERKELGLKGFLPPKVLTIDDQAKRAYEQYSAQPDDLSKNVYLTALHDRNETLFYRLLNDHLGEMLPIVYTPTVGTAIQRYSHEYRKPRGLYLSIDDPDGMKEASLSHNTGLSRCFSYFSNMIVNSSANSSFSNILAFPYMWTA